MFSSSGLRSRSAISQAERARNSLSWSRSFARTPPSSRSNSVSQFARVAEERQRLAHLPARGQKLGGARACCAPLRAREAVAQLVEKKLAKQRMIVIARLVAATPIGEKMAAIEVFEQSRGLFVSGERDGIGRRNRWWNRCQHQDALILGFRTAEDLAGEV